MPATRRQQKRSKKTMRAGAKPKRNVNADAAALKVTRFIDGSLKQIGKATDEMAAVFGAYNPSYYKSFGLAPAKKKAAKIFDDLEKLEELVKKNKYYDRNYYNSKNES